MENAPIAPWETPEGALSFASEWESSAGVFWAVRVRIRRSGHTDQGDVVVVPFEGDGGERAKPSHFNIRFAGGYLAYGRLHWDYERVAGHEVSILRVEVTHGADGAQPQTAHGVLTRVAGDQPEPRPWPPQPEPEPEPEPCPEPRPEPFRPIPAADTALFPYLYIRQWPFISAAQAQRRFVSYTPPPSTEAQGFYGDLCKCSSRAAMDKLALSFIHGTAPYTPSPCVTLEQLATGTYALLTRLKEVVLASDYDPQTVSTWVTAHLPSNYGAAVATLWDSYFALVVVPWCRPELLPPVCSQLVMAHLASQVYAPPAGTPLLTRTALCELMQATITLPDGFFSPPANTSPPSAAPSVAGGWIEPCSIGDLQMVRQRLLRHVPGEIAAIENLMRGERKDISRRRVRRQVDVSLSQTLDAQALEDSAADARDDLHTETSRTIGEKTTNKTYNKLSTTYGPPTVATVNGGPVTTTVQRGPDSDDATRFAREVLNKTVNRISRNVDHLRGSSVLHETAETITSNIDNSAGASNQIYVLRWVNKLYEARVVNYGCRLMVEFVLVAPATAYFRDVAPDERALFGPPKTLEQQGIDSFKKITPENYAALGAEYRSTAINPPPQARRDVSVLLGEGESAVVAVPAGYQAQIATASAIAAPQASCPSIMVGVDTFAIPYKPMAIHFGCGDSLIIAVGRAQAAASVPAAPVAPVTPPAPAPEPMRVNITVKCVPTAHAMDEWRIKTYNALLDARQALCVDNAALETPVTRERSALAARRVERRELRRGCLALLQQRCANLTGYLDPGSPTFAEDSLAETGRVQFVDDMFEWDEMNIQFYRQDDGAHYPLALDDDGAGLSPLAAFQAADLARVLVPVRPRTALIVLYLLSSGQLWPAGCETVPIEAHEMAIANALKAAQGLAHEEMQCVGRPWEILVPTAMQVIDGVCLDGIL